MSDEEDPWVICCLKADEINDTWLKEHKKAIVKRMPNGDVMLKFRKSELAKRAN